MFLVRHATRAATPRRGNGLPEVELAVGAEEGGHDQGGQGRRRDLAQERCDARRDPASRCGDTRNDARMA